MRFSNNPTTTFDANPARNVAELAEKLAALAQEAEVSEIPSSTLEPWLRAVAADAQRLAMTAS